MAVNNLGPIRLNPRGEFNPTAKYKYLDLVIYKGSSYVCINLGTLTGESTCQGILPVGDEKSETYFQLHGARGEQGLKADKYDNFITITAEPNPVWDYLKSDKIIIPVDMEFDEFNLDIQNVYDGCCGMIVTRNRNIVLPSNSDYALDFDYVNLAAKQYYMYTFVYCEEMDRFIWNRTVIQGDDD